MVANPKVWGRDRWLPRACQLDLLGEFQANETALKERQWRLPLPLADGQAVKKKKMELLWKLSSLHLRKLCCCSLLTSVSDPVITLIPDKTNPEVQPTTPIPHWEADGEWGGAGWGEGPDTHPFL